MADKTIGRYYLINCSEYVGWYKQDAMGTRTPFGGRGSVRNGP